MSSTNTTSQANNNPTYSGISFPPRKSPTSGFFYIDSDIDLITDSIYVILNTKKGSMPMNADFGSSAQSLLFQPINNTVLSLITDAIQDDIETYEPRVNILSISSIILNTALLFNIQLQMKSTGQQFTIQQTYSTQTT